MAHYVLGTPDAYRILGEKCNIQSLKQRIVVAIGI